MASVLEPQSVDTRQTLLSSIHKHILQKNNVKFFKNFCYCILNFKILNVGHFLKKYVDQKKPFNIDSNAELFISKCDEILQKYTLLEDKYNKDISILQVLYDNLNEKLRIRPNDKELQQKKAELELELTKANANPCDIKLTTSQKTEYKDIKLAKENDIDTFYTHLNKYVIWDIFYLSDCVKKAQIIDILNGYIYYCGNTIPKNIYINLKSLLDISEENEELITNKNEYKVKIIRPMKDNCSTVSDNICDKYEIIYNDFIGEQVVNHECLDFFKKENKMYISHDKDTFIYNNLEEYTNVYPKYWKDIANKISSNIVVFHGITSLLCTSDFNICNTLIQHLGIHYHLNNTTNILMSCANSSDAFEMSHTSSVGEPLISVISFEDRVGLYSNHIFSCRSFQLYNAPFLNGTFSKTINTYFNNEKVDPIIFKTVIKKEDDLIFFKVKAVFDKINTSMLTFIKQGKATKTKEVFFSDIKQKLKELFPSIFNEDGYSLINDMIDRDKQNFDNLFISVYNGKIAIGDNVELIFLNKFITICKQIFIPNAEAESESNLNSELVFNSDYVFILSRYLLFGILEIYPQYFVNCLLELMSYINDNTPSKFYFPDYHINKIAKSEQNANKYRLMYKELLKEYSSSCNLCDNIGQVITNNNKKKYKIILQTDRDDKYCNIWPKQIDDETLNFENNINFKIFIELLLDKLEINHINKRQPIYNKLNEHANTIENINIFQTQWDNIIKELLPICFYYMINFGVTDFINLQDDENTQYYFNNPIFFQNYNNFVELMNDLNIHFIRYRIKRISYGGKFLENNKILGKSRTKKNVRKISKKK